MIKKLTIISLVYKNNFHAKFHYKNRCFINCVLIKNSFWNTNTSVTTEVLKTFLKTFSSCEIFYFRLRNRPTAENLGLPAYE